MPGEWDLPFEPQEQQDVTFDEPVMAGGLTVMAAVVPVPKGVVIPGVKPGDKVPALVFRFLDCQLQHYPRPFVLVVSPEQMLSVGALCRNAARRAVDVSRGGN